MAQHDEAAVRMSPLPEPAEVERLDRAATNHPNHAHRLARRAERGRNDRRRARPRSLLEHPTQRLATSLCDERGDGDRPEPVDRTIEEDHEQEDPEPEERSRHRHAEVRHVVLLDVAHERVRVGEGADQHGEHGLEGPVAIEDPHVARRERPRRHLHDEDAHGDDEPDEPHARGDDGCEHGLRRCRRVLPASGQVRNRAEVRGHEAPGPPERATDERDHPQALPQVAAQTERDAPRHGARFYSIGRSVGRTAAFRPSLSEQQSPSLRWRARCRARGTRRAAALPPRASGT